VVQSSLAVEIFIVYWARQGAESRGSISVSALVDADTQMYIRSIEN